MLQAIEVTSCYCKAASALMLSRPIGRTVCPQVPPLYLPSAATTIRILFLQDETGRAHLHHQRSSESLFEGPEFSSHVNIARRVERRLCASYLLSLPHGLQTPSSEFVPSLACFFEALCSLCLAACLQHCNQYECSVRTSTRTRVEGGLTAIM